MPNNLLNQMLASYDIQSVKDQKNALHEVMQQVTPIRRQNSKQNISLLCSRIPLWLDVMLCQMLMPVKCTL
jgi:hypothetical protein